MKRHLSFSLIISYLGRELFHSFWKHIYTVQEAANMMILGFQSELSGFQYSVAFTPVLLCPTRFPTNRLLRYNTNVHICYSACTWSNQHLTDIYYITDIIEENLHKQTIHKSQVHTLFSPQVVCASYINTSGACTWMKETSWLLGQSSLYRMRLPLSHFFLV